MNVLVYAGPGTAKGSLEATLHALRGLLSSRYDVIPVNAGVFLKDSWQQTTSLVVVPGGRDLPYVESLSPNGTSKIRDWVRQGGKYFGICAGAYFGSSRVEFEVGRPGYEVVGRRDLGFVAATARGSATPDFVYDTDSSARAVQVQVLNLDFCEKPISLYCNGGPFFDLDCAEGVNVLAIYKGGVIDDALDMPAIVESKFGDGHVLLSGLHLEYSGLNNVKENAVIDPVTLQTLASNEGNRKGLLRRLLQKIGIMADHEADDLFDLKASPMFLSYAADSGGQQFAASILKKCTNGVLKDTENSFTIVNDVSTVPSESNSVIIWTNEGKSPNREYTPLFNMTKYFYNLDSIRALSLYRYFGSSIPAFGSIVLYGEVVSSTQTLLEKNATLSGLLPDGLVCVGSHQLSGRGRGKNSWISQQGCLQFSLSLKHRDVKSAVFVQYLFGLAVVEAVRSKSGYEGIPLYIKWPNDIYCTVSAEGTTVDVKKIGGILVTSSYHSGYFSLIIGCGLNVSNSKPTFSINDLIREYNVTSGCRVALQEFSLEELLSRILLKFQDLYDDFVFGRGTTSSFAFEPFLDLYYQRWLHSNQVVTLEDQNNVKARVVGIDASGVLKAVTEDGETHLLQPDGNSFDMMKGLISSKK